jgi:hypothetical protein
MPVPSRSRSQNLNECARILHGSNYYLRQQDREATRRRTAVFTSRTEHPVEYVRSDPN